MGAVAQPAVVDEVPVKYRKWINEEVVYIISDKERKIFFQLENNAQRDRFVEEFWQQRDPSPGTEKNEFKGEHYRRIEYANKWLGRETGKPGWKTDRGRIYILLGEPKEVRRYHSSQQLVPQEMWFYEVDPTLGVPPFFYCIFFKKYGVGEFVLYDPLLHGPESLIFLSAGESFEHAAQKIYDIDPELAQASINLVPTEMSDIESYMRPALSSIQLISKIENVPNYRRSAEYAERILRGEPRVDTRYAFDSSTMPSSFHVVKLAGGDSILNYSFHFPAAKLELGQYEDTLYTALEVLLSVMTEDGNVLVSRSTPLDQEFAPEHRRKLQRGGIAFEDQVLLLPGTYDATLTVRNKITKVFHASQAKITIPSFRAAKLELGEPLLFNRSENIGVINPDSVPPYAFYTLKMHPLMTEAVAKGQVIGVMYQLYAPVRQDRGPNEGVQVTYKLIKPNGEVANQVTNLVDSGKFDALGAATVFWRLDTNQLALDKYKIEISAVFGEEQVKVTSLTFKVATEGPAGEPLMAYGKPMDFSGPGPVREKGKQLLGLGESEVAQNLLSSALQRWPSDSSIGSLYADALAEAGKREEAIDVLLKMYLREPNEVQWQRKLGMLYLQVGKFNKSVSFFEKVRLLEGDSVEVLNPLGEAYRFAGNIQKAREIWERSLTIESDQPRIARRLAQLKEEASDS